MSISPSEIGAMFGGEKNLGRPCRTWSDLEVVLETGFPRKAVEYFADRYVGSITTLTKLIPEHVSYRNKGETTQQLLRIARVAVAARSAIGTVSGTKEFLLEPHIELCGRCPLQVALTELGVWQCEELTKRAVFGNPL